MNLVGDGRAGTRLVGAHARELLLGEVVGLEIGEAPVGIAKRRTGLGSRAVGSNRLRLPAQCLECVGDREVQVRGLGRTGQEVAKNVQCLLVLT